MNRSLRPTVGHQLAHAVVPFASPRARPNVSIGSAMICADRHARVERRVGVLEDHLHVPPLPPQRAGRQRA